MFIWKPLVPSQRVRSFGSQRVPHSSRSHALRGAPKGRVGHKFSELNFLRKFRRAAAASRSLECVTFRIVLVLKTASSRNKIYSVSSVTLPKQCSTHTPKGEPKIFWNFQSKFDCNVALPNMFNITCYVTMLLGLTNLLWKFQPSTTIRTIRY